MDEGGLGTGRGSAAAGTRRRRDPLKTRPAIDEKRLRAFLSANVAAIGDAPIRIGRIRGGQSNLNYRLDAGGASYVLRRPPPGRYLPKAHDVVREYRVLELLVAAGARVPAPVAVCSDPDVIGAPFAVTEFVEGVVLRDRVPAGFESVESRQRLGEELVDALVEIHRLDWEAVDFGSVAPAPPNGYLERQVRRWTAQWELVRTREVKDVDYLGRWFASHLPETNHPTVVHGTFALDNTIFDVQTARAVAVVDWEMATVGDPVADLGFFTALWVEPGEHLEGLLMFGSATSEPGFPTRRELVERYVRASGRDVPRLRWYQAFAYWKLAVLLEGSHMRFLAGTVDGSLLGGLEDGVPELAARARRLTVGLAPSRDF